MLCIDCKVHTSFVKRTSNLMKCAPERLYFSSPNGIYIVCKTWIDRKRARAAYNSIHVMVHISYVKRKLTEYSPEQSIKILAMVYASYVNRKYQSSKSAKLIIFAWVPGIPWKPQINLSHTDAQKMNNCVFVGKWPRQGKIFTFSTFMSLFCAYFYLQNGLT